MQRLLDEGSQPSAKEALRYVVSKAGIKNIPTGYDHLRNFDAIYRAYRIFNSRYRLMIQDYVL